LCCCFGCTSTLDPGPPAESPPRQPRDSAPAPGEGGWSLPPCPPPPSSAPAPPRGPRPAGIHSAEPGPLFWPLCQQGRFFPAPPGFPPGPPPTPANVPLVPACKPPSKAPGGWPRKSALPPKWLRNDWGGGPPPKAGGPRARGARKNAPAPLAAPPMPPPLKMPPWGGPPRLPCETLKWDGPRETGLGEKIRPRGFSPERSHRRAPNPLFRFFLSRKVRLPRTKIFFYPKNFVPPPTSPFFCGAAYFRAWRKVRRCVRGGAGYPSRAPFMGPGRGRPRCPAPRRPRFFCAPRPPRKFWGARPGGFFFFFFFPTFRCLGVTRGGASPPRTLRGRPPLYGAFPILEGRKHLDPRCWE